VRKPRLSLPASRRSRWQSADPENRRALNARRPAKMEKQSYIFDFWRYLAQATRYGFWSRLRPMRSCEVSVASASVSRSSNQPRRGVSMKKFLSGLAVLPFLSTVALAQPIQLSHEQMDAVSAGDQSSSMTVASSDGYVSSCTGCSMDRPDLNFPSFIAQLIINISLS
jgi:hypothetical protein